MNARHAIALTVGTLLLAACASPPSQAPAWRVEPLWRVDSAASSGAAAYARARVLQGEGRWLDALEQYRRAAQAEPRSPDVVHAWGLALARAGRIDEAVQALQRAATLAPERADIQNNLGYALLLAGRPAEAVPALQAALADEPTHAWAQRNLRAAQAQLAGTDAFTAAVHGAMSSGTMSAPESTAVAAAAAPAVIPANRAEAPSGGGERQAEGLPKDLRVVIINGNGVTGAAARLRAELQQQGLPAARLANLKPYRTARTTIFYAHGHEAEARWLAGRMPIAPTLLGSMRAGRGADLRVLIGHDMRANARAPAFG